ncbi:MAG: cell division FtsA domain-containing protein, partial [Clostridia bacterium]
MSGFFTKDIAVLDVSSHLISAIIGAKSMQSVFCIKALNEKEYAGFEDGEWLDDEDTVSSASEVLKDALDASNSKAKTLFIVVPAEFIAVVNKEVSITLDKTRRVIDADIDFLLKKGDTFDHDKYLTINSSAVYFSVDTTDKLFNDVRGLSAKCVTARISYILCDRKFVLMFDKIAKSKGFKDVQYISSSWAEGLSLLEKEQRDQTYVIVDIGYISSSIAIGRGDGVLDIKSFSLGGGHISADIYDCLDVPFELAEKARELVDLNLAYSPEAILVSDSKNTIFALEASEIVKARLDIFADIISDVLRGLPQDIPSYMSIYLTGEGVASMRGVKKYMSSLLGKNVEILTPK